MVENGRQPIIKTNTRYMTFAKRLYGMLLVTLVTLPAFGQGITGARQVCDSGSAAGFECSNVDLIAWMDRSQLTTEPLATDPFGNTIQPSFQMNDMWGWEHDESGRSFLVVGRTNGTAFVEVTDPFNPVFLGELPSSEVDSQGNPRHSTWRDMKVYANHAYIVADGAPGHGMQVFDLTQLLTVTDPQVFSLTNHYTLVSSVHNIVINEDTGYAFAVGMGGGIEPCGSGLHIINLDDPANPEFIGCYAEFGTSRGGGGYTHDAHCVVYDGPDDDWSGSEICVNSNEQSVVFTDVTQKQAPSTISVGRYPATEYTHQGWLSDDHRYYFQGDELDEARGTVGSTRTIIWDVQDLDDPVVAGEFFAQRNTIDHNMYVRGHLLFQSQYVDGLRILDISDAVNPIEVGFFDTHPSDASVWAGSWSNYPFMKDNMVAATSSTDGLFIMQPASSLVTAIESGQELPEAVSLLDVYPNPFMSESMVEIVMARTESVRVELIDALGRSIQVLFEGTVSAGETLRQYLPGDGLAAGMYLVRVQGESFETTRRIVKAR